MSAAPIERRPPPRSRVAWVEQAQEAYDHRGQWKVLGPRRNNHCARTMVSEINRGRLWAFQPAGHFEAYCARNWVYVRYLGEGV